MTAITYIFAGGVAAAALAVAAPAEAQFFPGYGYGYGYGNPYGGPAYAPTRQMAINECASAVQARLGGGYEYGYENEGGRVLGISQVGPRADGGFTVRGVASSGRYAGYGYGSRRPDLTWRCGTDFRGAITDVRINPAQPAYGYEYNSTPWNYDYSQYGYRRY